MTYQVIQGVFVMMIVMFILYVGSGEHR